MPLTIVKCTLAQCVWTLKSWEHCFGFTSVWDEVIKSKGGSLFTAPARFNLSHRVANELQSGGDKQFVLYQPWDHTQKFILVPHRLPEVLFQKRQGRDWLCLRVNSQGELRKEIHQKRLCVAASPCIMTILVCIGWRYTCCALNVCGLVAGSTAGQRSLPESHAYQQPRGKQPSFGVLKLFLLTVRKIWI